MRRPRFSRFDTPLTVERRAQAESSLTGERQEVWTAVGMAFAQAKPMGGRLDEDEYEIGESRYSLTMRADPRFQLKAHEFRLVWDSRVYEIEHIKEMGLGRERWVEVLVVER